MKRLYNEEIKRKLENIKLDLENQVKRKRQKNEKKG
jgi:hypothetical protein